VTFGRRARLVLLLGAVAAAAGGWYGYRHWRNDPDRVFARGRAALAAGDADAAFAAAARLRAAGREQQALVLSGEAWLRIAVAGGGRTPPDEAYRRAMRAFGEVRDDGPVGADAAALAGECLARLGEHRVAANVLNATLKRFPDHRDAHRWLAAVFIDLNSPRDAVEHLREWGRLAPDDGRPFRWIGLFEKDYRHTDKAVAAYEEALRRSLDPGMRADVSRELAEALRDGEADYRGMLRVLDGCPEPYAARPEMLTLRAEAEWGLGDGEAAAELLDRVFRDAPGYAPALRLRGQMYLAVDEPAKARPLLEESLRADPFDLGGRQLAVEACHQLGDEAAAAGHRKAMEEVREQRKRLSLLYVTARDRPWDPLVRVEIAELCLAINRRQEAEQMARAALACDPANAEARRLLDRIRSAGPPAGR